MHEREISDIALLEPYARCRGALRWRINQRRTFMINSRVVMLIGATGLTAALAAPARAEDVLTVHRLSAALAARRWPRRSRLAPSRATR
jgi:hypothetical protein